MELATDTRHRHPPQTLATAASFKLRNQFQDKVPGDQEPQRASSAQGCLSALDYPYRASFALTCPTICDSPRFTLRAATPAHQSRGPW